MQLVFSLALARSFLQVGQLFHPLLRLLHVIVVDANHIDVEVVIERRHGVHGVGGSESAARAGAHIVDAMEARVQNRHRAHHARLVRQKEVILRAEVRLVGEVDGRGRRGSERRRRRRRESEHSFILQRVRAGLASRSVRALGSVSIESLQIALGRRVDRDHAGVGEAPAGGVRAEQRGGRRGRSRFRSSGSSGSRSGAGGSRRKRGRVRGEEVRRKAVVLRAGDHAESARIELEGQGGGRERVTEAERVSKQAALRPAFAACPLFASGSALAHPGAVQARGAARVLRRLRLLLGPRSRPSPAGLAPLSLALARVARARARACPWSPSR
jgi:hypothetical protein